MSKLTAFLSFVLFVLTVPATSGCAVRQKTVIPASVTTGTAEPTPTPASDPFIVQSDGNGGYIIQKGTSTIHAVEFYTRGDVDKLIDSMRAEMTKLRLSLGAK